MSHLAVYTGRLMLMDTVHLFTRRPLWKGEVPVSACKAVRSPLIANFRRGELSDVTCGNCKRTVAYRRRQS